jgi:hypothetical protein
MNKQEDALLTVDDEAPYMSKENILACYRTLVRSMKIQAEYLRQVEEVKKELQEEVTALRKEVQDQRQELHDLFEREDLLFFKK